MSCWLCAVEVGERVVVLAPTADCSCGYVVEAGGIDPMTGVYQGTGVWQDGRIVHGVRWDETFICPRCGAEEVVTAFPCGSSVEFRGSSGSAARNSAATGRS